MLIKFIYRAPVMKVRSFVYRGWDENTMDLWAHDQDDEEIRERSADKI